MIPLFSLQITVKTMTIKLILENWRQFLSEKAKKTVGDEISAQRKKGKPQDQAVAIALSKKERGELKEQKQDVYSFDYDNTLIRYRTLEDGDVEYLGPHEENIQTLRDLAAAGNKVIIVTSRAKPVGPKKPYDDAPLPGELVSELNLPVEEIYYTAGDLKADKLVELDVIKHWDDDEEEIAAADAAGIETKLVPTEGFVTEALRYKWLTLLTMEGVDVDPKMKKYLDNHPYMEPDGLQEKWSEKYKKSIDCNNPKGFSQKAHCAGRKKRNEQLELDERCQKGYKTHPTRKTKKMYGKTYRNCIKAEEGKDPKTGTGKKPKGSGRRLYTDEDPSDTVSVKFRTVQDVKDTLSKKSFKAKSHKRQSQIINHIHQRVRAAHKNAKDPKTKARLKKVLDHAEKRKEASKEKTKRLQKKKD